MTLRTLAIVLLVGCSTAPPAPMGRDAGRDAPPDAPPWSTLEACDLCNPSCATGAPSCVPDDSGTMDCAACFPRCGSYAHPTDAPTVCGVVGDVVTCGDQQALFCFRALP